MVLIATLIQPKLTDPAKAHAPSIPPKLMRLPAASLGLDERAVAA
jgi:hypothetical protein